MSRRSRTSLRADIQDLDSLLKRAGASQTELAHMANPKSFEILMHPFTIRIINKYPEYTQILTNIGAMERVRKLARMDAEEKLIDLGIVASAKETLDKEVKKEDEEGTDDESP